MTSLGEVEVLEQLRVRVLDLHVELVEEYVEALREGAMLPPVQVVKIAERLVLVDGRHRIAAWMALDMPVDAVAVAECSEAEALEWALAANMRHGMRRNQGDVARCIELALGMWPEASQREIARRVGCSHTRVNQIVAGRVETSFHSKSPEGLAPEADTIPSASAWQSPWTPESFHVEVSAGEADPQGIKLGEALGSVDPEGGLSWSFVGPGQIQEVEETPQAPEEVSPKSYRGRDALERWYTPVDMATVCWRWLLKTGLMKDRMPWCEGASLRVLEPCVGGGAWLKGLEALVLEQPGLVPRRAWTVCDVDPEAPGLREVVAETICGDVVAREVWRHGFDMAISNPPNSRALEVIQACMAVVEVGGLVVMLMPSSWLAAQRRRAWLRQQPPLMVAHAPWRPGFEGPAAELQETDGGSPTQDYSLYVWRVGDPPGETWTGTWIDGGVGDGEE